MQMRMTWILRVVAQDPLPARARKERGPEADLTRRVTAGESGSTPIRPRILGAEIGPSGDFCTHRAQKSGMILGAPRSVGAAGSADSPQSDATERVPPSGCGYQAAPEYPCREVPDRTGGNPT